MAAKTTIGEFVDWILGKKKTVIATKRLPPNVTGKKIINEIVGAIALDQSVLLIGPRGCGKSYCIEAAISEALSKNLIAPYSADVEHLFIQGNSEIPRDYFAEDDLVFKLLRGEIVPRIRSAPLFKAAARNDDGELLVERGEARWPVLQGKRFVLFLDEINRFSNGVLDSLLSILEERRAVIGGEAVRVPVSVCMTMNPPGYDATAKNLSPPLAARIGRTIRLSTPDLDTLSDEIIVGKVDRSFPGTRWPVFKDSNVELTIPMVLLRAAGLTTLCMWGTSSTLATRPGLLYLTSETLTLIDAVAKTSAIARKAMDELSGLSLFGPDGRAAADWAVSAIGRAHSEALKSKTKLATLENQHFISTVVSSISGKVVDNFSSASRPDLTVKKELAIRNLAIEIFHNRRIIQLLRRECDSDNSTIWRQFEAFDFEKSWTQRLLWRARAGADDTVKVILKLMQGDKSWAYADQNQIESAFLFFEAVTKQVEKMEPHDREELINAGKVKETAKRCYDALALKVDQTLVDLSDSVQFIRDFVTESVFRRVCEDNKLDRTERALLANQIDSIWRGISENPDDLLTAQNYLNGPTPEFSKLLIDLLKDGFTKMDPPPKPPEENGLIARFLNWSGIKREDAEDTAYRARYVALHKLLGDKN